MNQIQLGFFHPSALTLHPSFLTVRFWAMLLANLRRIVFRIASEAALRRVAQLVETGKRTQVADSP